MRKWTILLFLFLSTVTLAQSTDEPIMISQETANSIKALIIAQDTLLKEQQKQIFILQDLVKEMKKHQCTDI